MNDMRDWQSLGDQWRGQAVAKVDVDALRAEVRSRSRRLQQALAAEVLLSLLIVAWLGWALRFAGEPAPVNAVFALLMAFTIAFQAWSLWIRRRQLRDGGLEAGALLALEVDRAHTSLRYWRYGTWLGLLLWLALYVFVVLAMPHAGSTKQLYSLLGGVIGGAMGLLVSALIAWWKGRGTLARLARLRGLQDELGDG